MKMERWQKRIGNLLLLAGGLLLSYLVISQLYMNYQEQALIDQLENLSSLPPEQAQAANSVEQQSTSAASAQADTNANDAPANGPKAVALLQIPKIDLRVPVAEGSLPETLNYAVGHLEQTGQLGVTGANFVVVGHRSNAFGRFFNRLDELQSADEFVLKAQGKTYTYRVVNKQIIQPTQIEVTRSVAGTSRVTLITCHPAYSDKQRLVVTAELVAAE